MGNREKKTGVNLAFWVSFRLSWVSDEFCRRSVLGLFVSVWVLFSSVLSVSLGLVTLTLSSYALFQLPVVICYSLFPFSTFVLFSKSAFVLPRSFFFSSKVW